MRDCAFDASRAKFGYIIRDSTEQVPESDLNMFCFLHSRPSMLHCFICIPRGDESAKGEGGCEKKKSDKEFDTKIASKPGINARISPPKRLNQLGFLKHMV